MNNRYEGRDYHSVQQRRQSFHRSIRKDQICHFFQDRRRGMIQSSIDEVEVQQIKEQIKHDQDYFKNVNQPLSHIPAIVSILKSNSSERGTLAALICITSILRQNKNIFYKKIVSFEPNFEGLLFQLLQSSSARVKIKVLNIFNWMASEYQALALEKIWRLQMIDLLNDFIQKTYPTPNFYRISINLISNMVRDHRTCSIVRNHSIFSQIVALLKHPKEEVHSQSFACIETLSQYLQTQQLNHLIKSIKMIPVICMKLEQLEYSNIHIGIDCLRIVKRYIQANMNQESDFNPAVDELQRVYHFGALVEKIAFSATASTGPVLTIAELADEIVDIMSQCVNGDSI